MKRSVVIRFDLSIIAVAILVFVLGGFALLVVFTRVGGLQSSYNAVDFDPYLTATAKSATPLIRALELYRREHHVFPPQASDLAQYLPTEAGTDTSAPPSHVLGWNYIPMDNGKAFTLSRGLGWDPGLFYRFDGSNGRWVFDPGDGSPEKTMRLNP